MAGEPDAATTESVGFRLLGRVSAWRGDAEVDLGPARQRAVLAVLLLCTGQAVAVGDILEAVWGSAPPDNGPNVLSKYIGRLRRCIGGVDTIPHLSGGYRMERSTTAVDLLDFERAVARARSLRRAGELPRASAELESALGLWRGTPLIGVTSPFLDAERERLEQLRLAVTEEHIDMDLRLGRHRLRTTDLMRLVAAHPLREGFTAQLMLALYRNGQQGQAQDAYHALRRRLDEELGVGPGRMVTQLHEAILRGDAELEAEPAPAEGEDKDLLLSGDGSPVVPRQLPAVLGDFTGRTAEQRRIESWLDATAAGTGRAQAVVITGPGGVGKTSLAIQVAHEICAAYPDGQIVLPFTPGEQAADASGRILRALGAAGAAAPDPAERLALVRTLTADKRLLLLCDNVISEHQVAPLIPTSSRSAVIITSRRELTGLSVAGRLGLGMLPQPDALHLLEAIVGPERLRQESATARVLIRLCGRLPLALRIVGARIAANPHWSLARLADRLKDEHRRLDELRHQDLAVRASLAVGHELLTPCAKELLARMSLLDAPDIPQWAAAVLLDCDTAQAEDCLDELVGVRLVDAVSAGDVRTPRYRLHDLVRLFAREQADAALSPDDRDAVLDRAFGAWLGLAEEADAALPHGYFSRPVGPVPRNGLDPRMTEHLLRDPLQWFDTEHSALTALVIQAARTGRTATAWELAGALVAYFELRSHCTEWHSTHAEALKAVDKAGDQLGAAVILRGMGELHTLQDRVAPAIDCFSRARAIFAELGEEHGAAVCTSGIGHMYRVSGRYDEAREAFSEATHSSVRTGHLRNASYALHCLGVVHLERGEHTQAATAFHRALALASQSSYLRGMAQTERGLGHLSLALGDPDTAEQHAENALSISTGLGEPSGEAHALHLLAEARLRADRLATVPALLERARAVYSATGEPFGEALVLHTYSEYLRMRGESARALTAADQAVRLWTTCHAPRWLARTLRVLGDIHADLDDMTHAQVAWDRASELFGKLGLQDTADLARRPDPTGGAERS